MYANNKGADQTVQLHSLISTFNIRRLKRIINIYATATCFKVLFSLADQIDLLCNKEDRILCEMAKIQDVE